MKNFRNLNTYYKLLVLIITTSILFFFLYVTLYVYTSKQENHLYTTTQKQYYNEVTSIIKLNSKTPLSTITDITFWDDLDDFTIKKDKIWYNDYIASQFETYEVDYLGVYDINGQFIIKTSNAKIKTSEFIPIEVIKQLHQSKLMRFYVKTTEGVIEVFGATIHPGDDPKKIKSKPSGYFFMAKLIDKDYCKILNNFSSSEVNLVQVDAITTTDKNLLQASVKLKNFDNTQVGVLQFSRPFNLNFKNTKEILMILMLASLVNILVYLYFARKWVYKPLGFITDVLETGNETSISSLKGEPGEFSHIGKLFEENNYHRRQLEISKEKAEESDRLKSSFLANLSHEIRTPMNAIVGFSDLLNDPTLSEEERKEYLAIIQNCGINLVSIIEDLIEMSKIDSKQITPNFVSVDLARCIKEIYETIKVTVPEEKELELHFIENKDDVTKNVLTDVIKLKQVIVNLISNAIKYTEKGKVTFSYRIDELHKTIVFSVQDTGLGIDKENLKVIFDRFRRIEDEFSAELGGLGLGLAISEAYVAMLGGTISVRSELKVGSVFTFTIPLLYDDLVPENNQDRKVNIIKKSNNKTILIAEDDNINFLLLKRILELKKYNVLRAENGQEAVNICSANSQIHLVFMDIKMPVLNGFEAFKKIHSFNPHLPIIAQTAYVSMEDEEKIMKAGFTAYVAKPLDKEKVFELVATVFDHC
jgi:signal transduction histidine kinase